MSAVGRCNNAFCDNYGTDIPPAPGSDKPPELCPKCGKALRLQTAEAGHASPAEAPPADASTAETSAPQPSAGGEQFYGFREPAPAPTGPTPFAAGAKTPVFSSAGAPAPHAAAAAHSPAAEPIPDIQPQPLPPQAEPEPAPVEGINLFEIFEQALDELTEIIRSSLDPDRPKAAPSAPRVLWITAIVWATAITLLLFTFEFLATWVMVSLLGAVSLAYLLRLGATVFALILLQRCNPFLRDLRRTQKKSKAKPAAAPTEPPPAA